MTRGATLVEKKTTLVLPTASLYDAHVVFDDGTGFTKGRLLNTKTGEEKTYRELAIVTPNDEMLDEYVMGGPTPGHVVAIPGQVFSNLVGPAGLRYGRASFEGGKHRYTTPAAINRFYACLGTLLGDMQEATVHLTAGANDEVIRTARNTIRRMFENPDANGKPQPHVFSVDQKSYRVTIARAFIPSQATSAAKSVRVTPPKSLETRIAQFPMESSTIVVIDGGRLSVDVAVLQPDEERPGQMQPVKRFSIMKGVGEMVTRLSNYITAQTGKVPATRQMEWIINPRIEHLYGWISTDEGKLDLRPAIAETFQQVWREIWQDISTEIKGVPFAYVLVVGGMAIVAADAIKATELPTKTGHILLGNYKGFAIPDEPHLAVARGMAALGDEDATRQT